MQTDYIKRYVEHGMEETPMSPMEPPEAKAPSSVPQLPRESFAQPLQELLAEHDAYQKILTVFENALLALKQNAWRFNPEISAGLKSFFHYFDHETVQHNKKEEKALFPVLRQRFLETGEHSISDHPVTPVEVMEEEHLKVAQEVTLVFNLLGLAPRLPDVASRQILLEHAFNLGQEIVETMQLHIYKENTVLFPLAQQLLSETEFLSVSKRMKEI